MDFYLVLLVVYFVLAHFQFDFSNGGRYSLSNEPFNVDVLTCGAIGDGIHDDTQAFIDAWAKVCGASIPNDIPTLIVPPGKTFLVSSITFNGPCKSPSIHVQIQGKIVAPLKDAWQNCNDNVWLRFSHIDNLIVDGSGTIDGQGSSWWAGVPSTDNSLIANTECIRPRALSFLVCNGLQLHGLTHLNSPGAHISINGCTNIVVSNLHIEAPADSPNTDGIDLGQSSHVQIRDLSITTGDDCIALGTMTSWVNITGVTCGPGHGISIGGLGKDGENAQVEQIYVQNCTFIGSSNGARIKTWQGGSGYVRDIIFEDIPLVNVKNPIIIDQYYCNGAHDCLNQTSAVAISGVTYRGFHGTSSTKSAISLKCSDTVACTGISIANVDITSSDPKDAASAVCNNAKVTQVSVIPQVPCLP